jgi:heme/copper-type cytochrome/quinol oxidase subunit 2
MGSIKWDALGVVAVASFGITVLVVVLAAFAMVGLSARNTAPDVATFEGGQRTTLSPAVGTGIAAVCLAAITAIVLYGLWIIVS